MDVLFTFYGFYTAIIDLIYIKVDKGYLKWWSTYVAVENRTEKNHHKRNDKNKKIMNKRSRFVYGCSIYWSFMLYRSSKWKHLMLSKNRQAFHWLYYGIFGKAQGSVLHCYWHYMAMFKKREKLLVILLLYQLKNSILQNL